MADFTLKMKSAKEVNDLVAHLDSVEAKVEDAAERLGARARNKLAAHRYEGEAKIVVDHSGLDSEVSLVSDGVFAIEYGHADREGGHVAGLRILRDSVAEMRE